MGVPVCVVCHDDSLYLPTALRSFRSAGPATVFVSRRAWDGSDGDWERCVRAAEGEGAEVVVGDWPDESLHRQTALEEMRRRGHAHVLIPDGDEVVEPSLLEALVRIADAGVAERVRVAIDTYWKSPRYVVRPREALMPLLMVDARVCGHERIREYGGGRQIVLPPEYGVLHHLSYAGPDERILRKISTWGHREEVGREWFRRVWQGWNRDRLMRDLHPTHPACYGWVERIEPAPVLTGAPDPLPVYEDPPVPEGWPGVSVVIPLYGGEEDIRACLSSLQDSLDLLKEVVVVDDVSPDGAAEAAASFPFVTLLRNEENRGFAGACNRGYRASAGKVVLFLNSDTVVPRAGLIRLVESLMSGGTVAAAGPMSNHVGYHQPVDATYTSLETMPLFARDLAHRRERDKEVDMLVGYCLAVKRRAVDEVGGAFDERFGRGMFEDNDLCYRLRRAGYRLLVSGCAFVHHEGSKSLRRSGEAPEAMLARNKAVYEAKWRGDLECGFASHLSGDSPEPIVFRPELHPEAAEERIRLLAERADVSLCMIVRNEERVLGDCLESARGVFTQVVVVDTGSTDRTREIALGHGAELHEFPWTDSFAEARTESMRHARGRWVMWMDADDTLPRRSADAILRAVAEAPEDVVGFVVPVQFVEPNGGYGTRVDHVKVFWNLPGLVWEGRIHEQILPALGRHPGRIERIEAVVLHSGYDTSDEGQARKRERDWRLLDLELLERPEHPFVHFNVGMTAHFCGEHQRALRHLRRSVEIAAPHESHVRKAYCLMGDSRLALEDLEGALETFREGIERVGEDPEIRFKGARTLQRLGRRAEARDWYLAVRADGALFTSYDRGILGHKLFHSLAELALEDGRYPEAREWLRRAIKEELREPASAVLLFEAAMEREDLRTAREALPLLQAPDPSLTLWAKAACQLAEARGEDPEPLLFEAAVGAPASPGPRLELARRMLESGREARALPLLDVLCQQGSAEAYFMVGVLHAGRGDLAGALGHMRRALELNPGHENTLRHIRAFEEALAPKAG